MEAPYVYHFADRHDRLSEVIDAGLTYMFTTGRGGVPGNNDSGGLCSLYVWNALGIFPVSGQDLMIIGSPRIKSACFSLSNGKTFTVRRYGSGIYVHDAYLNGRRLGSLCFGAREMMAGGTLELHMGDAPK
ncbi:MAG: glycoside hydrolase family 92 protein [Clostridia bacterium]|nr:glycoside hydrolase family 92 protein [Clostridia bacterium]